jgi:ParB family chromosome partitioning protein
VKARPPRGGSGSTCSPNSIINRSAASNGFKRPSFPLPAEVQAELSALEQRRDRFVQQLEDGDDDEDVDQQPLYDQIDEIEDRIQEIQLTQKRAYPEEVKAACGVVISVGQNGEPEFLYGLLRKEDEAALANSELRSGDPVRATETTDAANVPPVYSAALVESLTQQKTAAIAVELTAQPAIALAAVVYALSLSEFGLDLHLYRAKSAVQVSTSRSHLEGANGSPAFTKLEEQRQNWLRKLPRDSAQLWRFCLELDQTTLLQLMAYCLARSVNGVQSKNENDRERLEHTDALGTALQVDMAKWFTPTAENFFGRISKPRIAEALAEAGKPASAITLAFKKADLATVAEKEIQGTGWLPEPVRILEGIRETSLTSAA